MLAGARKRPPTYPERLWQSEHVNAELHPWTDRARGMLVGAAVGDAMGWPYERRDRTRSLPPLSQVAGRFFPWRRMAGSRFRPISEEIGPGEYSDDTQMLIAVARARLTAGDDWLLWLQRVEWPFFLDYERGAGASVKRACRAWEKHGTAWGRKADDQAQYFSTGANGAAMRIAPHVIAHREASFNVLAADVISDAATTHGHPRALLGALVHAYALWASMQQPAPLAYGWLIEATLDGLKDWREPVWQSFSRSWLDAASKAFPLGYEHAWDETVLEVEELLNHARTTLKSGALSAPSTFLESQGLTRAKTRGSGTLCAVAAIYLAARSAASPERGISVPARQEGADTDTLASMTASLLGAGLGAEWLGSYGREVQDNRLLVTLAERLLRPAAATVPPPAQDEASQARTAFQQALDGAANGGTLLLPDRREARVVTLEEVGSEKWRAHRTQLITADGQNLFFIRGSRRVERMPAEDVRQTHPEAHARLQGAYLPVLNINRVKEALNAMGLPLTKYGNDWISYENLVLRKSEEPEGRTIDTPVAQLRVAVDHAPAAWERMRAMQLEGSMQRGGNAFWVRVDPYLVIAVNNAEPPAPR